MFRFGLSNSAASRAAATFKWPSTSVLGKEEVEKVPLGTPPAFTAKQHVKLLTLSQYYPARH